jgi:hypothetical protein
VVAAASPSPSPAPSAPSDPCGSITSVVSRPSIASSVCAVPSGQVEVESGWSNTTTNGSPAGNTLAYGIGAIRFGTKNNHLDLELNPPNYATTSVGGPPAVSGWSDTAVGVKYEAGYNARAAWGVNGIATFPTGSSAFSAGGSQYTGNFNWTYTLNQTFGLGGTMGFNSFRASSISYFAWTPSVLLSATLPNATSVYGEFAYVSRAGPALASKSIFDFGYVRALTPHWQVDAAYGFSPTLIAAQRQSYIGFGLSFMH